MFICSHEYFVPPSRKDRSIHTLVFLILQFHVVCKLYLGYSNSQELERTQMSHNRGIDTENVVHLHNGCISQALVYLSGDSFIRLLSASTCWHPQQCLGLVIVNGMDPQVSQSLDGHFFSLYSTLCL